MTEIVKVAEQADMIINGYAFTKEGNDIRVLNLRWRDIISILHRFV